MSEVLPAFSPASPVAEPVRPVGLVVVGANFGLTIASQLNAAGGPVVVSGVCDLDMDKARQAAGRLGVRAYAGLDAVLDDPAVEAVGVFTGPVGRGRLIERIVGAGKHVMTTKPFELEPAEAARAFDAAERHGRALHLNSPAPCAPADLALIRRVLAGGELGRPVALQARTWADYQEKADGSWMDDPESCPAGPLFRLGVYFLNDFAGLPGRPVEVQVQHTRLRTGRPTADQAQIAIRYDTGALGNIFTSFCVGDGGPYRDEVSLVCERGEIRRWMEREGGVEMRNDRAVVEIRRRGAKVERFEGGPGDFAGWYGWEAFYAAVRGLPGAVMHDRAGTLAGVRLLAALREAARTGSARVASA